MTSRYADIDLWEIHEAFAAQVAFHLKALQSAPFLRDKAKVPRDFGAFPRGAHESQRRQHRASAIRSAPPARASSARR